MRNCGALLLGNYLICRVNRDVDAILLFCIKLLVGFIQSNFLTAFAININTVE